MVNKIILMGYVGKDPVIRHLDNNLVRADFTLATNEYRVKDGNKVEHTEWFNIVVWKNLAEVAEKYVRKGSLLYLEGKLNTRTYEDRDGNKRFSLDVNADTLKMVGSKPESGQTGNSGILEETPSAAEPPIGEQSDDLPF